MVNHRLLGPEFTNLGVLDGRTWDGQDDTPNSIDLPDPMVAFHANFAKGVEIKDRLLRAIRRVMTKGHTTGESAGCCGGSQAESNDRMRHGPTC